jgi:hypothetical protein
MASKVEIPGTDQNVNLSDPLGSVRSLLMAGFAFMLAIVAGVIGQKMYNVVASTTSATDQVDKI